MTIDTMHPIHRGVIAAEIYFPNCYVDQHELEEHDGNMGKYTSGLMQQKMAVCMDNEDVVSMTLTVVDRLMARLGMDPKAIGRIDVGSESHFDRAKSVRSFVMRLFPHSPNMSGSDHVGACFGGTAALFSALQWMESSMWDGRHALVIACDIAAYADGPARPTGGAAAIALLLGPDAPITISERPVFHCQDIYDFHKGCMTSEYPQVDGKLSIDAYLSSLKECFQMFGCAHHYDFLIFHTPYCKMAVKAAKELSVQSADKIELASVTPSLKLAAVIGNMYCGSVFAGILSCLFTDFAHPQRALVYSYGSGSTSCMFSIILRENSHAVIDRGDVLRRLDARHKLSLAEYKNAMSLRERLHLSKSYTPVHRPQLVNTWYLHHVDEQYRRHYVKL